MALRIAPLTEEEARKALEDWRLGYPKLQTYWTLLQEALEDPTPHVVHYRAGRYWYHRPENFQLLPRQRSPSDCTWIVPGT